MSMILNEAISKSVTAWVSINMSKTTSASMSLIVNPRTE